MRIKKAIFPVGGLGTRFLPATKSMPKEMLPVVDKPLIQYAVEEAAEAGITEFIFVTGRGKTAIEDHFDHSIELEMTLRKKSGAHKMLEDVLKMMKPAGSVAYIRQQEPMGLGHAVWCARHLIGDEPVAVLLADDLIHGEVGCLKQMVSRYESGNMIAAMEVPLERTSPYGVIDPGPINQNMIEVKGLVEKPQPEDAPSRWAVIGRYIIEPGVFKELDRQERGAGGEIQLTDALARRVNHTPFYGHLFEGTRYDCGSKLGFLKANISLAMERPLIRDELVGWMKTLVD